MLSNQRHMEVHIVHTSTLSLSKEYVCKLGSTSNPLHNVYSLTMSYPCTQLSSPPVSFLHELVFHLLALSTTTRVLYLALIVLQAHSKGKLSGDSCHLTVSH